MSDDLELLQGTWNIDSLEVEGQIMSDDTLADARVVIKDGDSPALAWAPYTFHLSSLVVHSYPTNLHYQLSGRHTSLPSIEFLILSTISISWTHWGRASITHCGAFVGMTRLRLNPAVASNLRNSDSVRSMPPSVWVNVTTSRKLR